MEKSDLKMLPKALGLVAIDIICDLFKGLLIGFLVAWALLTVAYFVALLGVGIDCGGLQLLSATEDKLPAVAEWIFLIINLIAICALFVWSLIRLVSKKMRALKAQNIPERDIYGLTRKDQEQQN